jgi:hypothetical protein
LASIVILAGAAELVGDFTLAGLGAGIEHVADAVPVAVGFFATLLCRITVLLGDIALTLVLTDGVHLTFGIQDVQQSLDIEGQASHGTALSLAQNQEQQECGDSDRVTFAEKYLP